MTDIDLVKTTFEEILTTEYNFVKDLTVFAAAASMLQRDMQRRNGRIPKRKKKPIEREEKLYNALITTLKGMRSREEKQKFLDMLQEYTDKTYAFLEAHPLFPQKGKKDISIEEVMSFAEYRSEPMVAFVQLCYAGSRLSALTSNKRIKFSPAFADEIIKPTQRSMRYNMLADALEKNVKKMSAKKGVGIKDSLKYLHLADIMRDGIGQSATKVNDALALEQEETKPKKERTLEKIPTLWQRLKNFATAIFRWNKKDTDTQSKVSTIIPATDVSATESSATTESPPVSPRNSNLSTNSQSSSNPEKLVDANLKAKQPLKWQLKPLDPNKPNDKGYLKAPPRKRTREPGDPFTKEKRNRLSNYIEKPANQPRGNTSENKPKAE